MQIETIEHRPSDAIQSRTSTSRSPTTIPVRIERRHHQDVGGKSHRPGGSGDGDHSIFQRLPQCVDGGGWELGEFIQQQHPTMRQTHLPGTRYRATSHQSRRTAGVMGRSERRRPESAGLGRQSRDRANHRRFKGGFVIKRWKDLGQPTSEHRLSTAGRTDEEKIVATGRGDLRRPTRRRLTSNPIEPSADEILDFRRH